MDTIVGSIADYAQALRYQDLPSEAVQHCKRCVVDSFGVALGAFDATPSRIGREMAERITDPAGARLIGTDHRTLPELAAFANGSLVRYFDGNDAFPGGGGHPSDTISAILAAADMKGADGRELILGITLAYEIYYNLFKSARIRYHGIDHVFYTSVGGAVGAAKLLGLDRKAMAEAISLAITPNIPLDSTRYGNLPMWKGCAGGNAARNSIFAVQLAQRGMTGPEKPIEGAHGLQNLVGKFELLPFGGAGHPFGITQVTLKCFMAEMHSLSPITASLQIGQQIDAAEIEKVTIYTYWYAHREIAGEPEKWRPKTRESADHSMPYIVAAVLIDRSFSDEIFSDERLQDKRIEQLMDKIEVKVDEALTSRFPEKFPCRIEITTKTGERKVVETDYPRGHYNNQMTDDEVSSKFRGLALRVLPKDRVEQVLNALWKLDTISDLSEIFELVQISKK